MYSYWQERIVPGINRRNRRLTLEIRNRKLPFQPPLPPQRYFGHFARGSILRCPPICSTDKSMSRYHHRRVRSSPSNRVCGVDISFPVIEPSSSQRKSLRRYVKSLILHGHVCSFSIPYGFASPTRMNGESFPKINSFEERLVTFSVTFNYA